LERAERCVPVCFRFTNHIRIIGIGEGVVIGLLSDFYILPKLGVGFGGFPVDRPHPQGQQRDIIFASYAVGDPDTIGQEEEFLLNLNRFNVTTSRARTKVVLFLTRSLVNHIAAEVEQIHQSAMIKEFVDLYCDQKNVCQLHWIDEENRPVGVPGVLHAKAFAADL
jgi:hypothetical protein